MMSELRQIIIKLWAERRLEKASPMGAPKPELNKSVCQMMATDFNNLSHAQGPSSQLPKVHHQLGEHWPPCTHA